MFQHDETGNITMHRGDTGAFKVEAHRQTGEPWTDADRMLYTIRNASGDVVLQRFYKLNNAFGLGEGVVEIQFHNNDTDTWENGTYNTERRYNIAPRWDGTPPEGACVNALTAGVRMVEGDVVRTVFQGQLTIADIYGEV